MPLRESVLAVFTAKTVVLVLAWGVWSVGWPSSWQQHERLTMLLQILAFVSAATTVWLRIERARDAYRRGYRAGREDAFDELDPPVHGPR